MSYYLAKIGKKIVTVKSFGKEKSRISCLLTITASGEKLSPFVIFKGQKGSTINKELVKFVESKKYNIIPRTQKRAWIDEEIFLEYIDMVLAKYKPNNNKLLILDYCPAHNTETILLKLKKNIDYLFIPKRMTSVLQPLGSQLGAAYS